MDGHIVVKELNDELMVYDTKKEAFHILNKTAAFFYQLLQKGKSIQEIELLVKKHFRLKAKKDIKSDIQKCLQTLREKELLQDDHME